MLPLTAHASKVFSFDTADQKELTTIPTYTGKVNFTSLALSHLVDPLALALDPCVPPREDGPLSLPQRLRLAFPREGREGGCQRQQPSRQEQELVFLFSKASNQSIPKSIPKPKSTERFAEEL